MTSYLTGNEFKRGNVDTTLFIREDKNHFVIAKVYVDDIVFSSTNDFLTKYFANEMKMFEISMVGEVIYFLRLQIK